MRGMFIFLLGVILSLVLVSAEYDFVNIVPPEPTTSFPVIYANISSNISDYWDGLNTPDDIDLNDLGDVNAGAPADEEVLTWDDATSKWIAKAISAISGWIIDSASLYLYNDSDTLYFNETRLNMTIDSRATGLGDNESWNQSLADDLYIDAEVDPQWESNWSLGYYLNHSQVVVDSWWSDFVTTQNDTYDAYATNVSINYSQNTYDFWNAIWSVGDLDTSASVNCSTTEVFLGNGSCLDSDLFFDDTTIADSNATTACSTDEVLLGNGSCISTSIFVDTTIPDSNATTACSDDEVLLGNGSCSPSDAFFDDTTIIDTSASVNCSTSEVFLGNGSCLDSDLFLVGELDTSASVNCSTTEVFLGNGSCLDSDLFFDDTTIADSNATTACSTDEVLLGNGSCISTSIFVDTTIPDSNATTACSDDEVLLGNGSCSPSDAFFDDTTIIDTSASVNCSTSEVFLGNGSCLDSDLFLVGELDTSASVNCSTTEVFLGNGSCLDSDDFYDDTTIGTLPLENLTISHWNNITGRFNYTSNVYDIWNAIWSASGDDTWSLNYTKYYNKSDIDNNLSNYILDASLPLENLTISHCGNITGATSDLCTLIDTTGADGNASSICNNNEVLLGDGSCYDLGHIQNSTNVTNHSIFIQLSDLTNQVFAATNTPQTINLTTEDESYGLVHSTTTNNSQITIVTSGVYAILAQPQVTAGAGDAGDFHMWLEKFNTTQWVNVSNSNVELDLASNDEDVILLAVVMSLKANEKIRVMGSVSDTGITLETISPAGEPVIPSIIFSMFITGPTEFTDTDTTYTNGSGISLVGTEFNHSDTSSQASDDNSGNTFIQDIILDTFGHITSIVNAAVDFSAYVAIADLVGMVGNWSADKSDYYNKSQVDNNLSNYILDASLPLENQTISHWNNITGRFNYTSNVYDIWNAIWSADDDTIFDNTNVCYINQTNIFTENQNFSNNNLTDIFYIKLNDIGGACDLTINGSICSNASGTYIVG